MEDDDLFFVDTAGEAPVSEVGNVVTKEEALLVKSLFGNTIVNDDEPNEGADDDVMRLVKGEKKRDRGVVKNEEEGRADRALWHDSDEEEDQVKVEENKKLKLVSGAEYEKRLRAQHEIQAPKAKWALDAQKKAQKQATDAASERLELAKKLFSQTGNVTSSSSLLASDALKIQRVTSFNADAMSDCVLECVRFFPSADGSSRLAMTAGRDKTLRVFQVGEKKSQKVYGAFFADLPIMQAEFIPKTSDILVAGFRKSFYVYNMESDSYTRVPHLLGQSEQSWTHIAPSEDGQYTAFCGGESGTICLWSNRSNQVAHSLRSGSHAHWSSWSSSSSSSSSLLWTAGTDGVVCQWDIRNTRRCVMRFQDKDSIGTTCMSVSKDGHWMALGDKSGMVNVYDLWQEGQQPKLHKSLDNLVTSVNRVVWNHDSQMLAISSPLQNTAVRLVHVPTFSVFPNWPGQSLRMFEVADVSFSPMSGYMAAGNIKGEAYTFRMLHYPTF